ncbi:MAG: hypothetical protein ACXADY_18160 [Candidatus Hodarchaeales archaeon]|jgi:hypothetical protein
MSTDNLYKKSIPEHSRISRLQRFLRSNTGFRIGIIIIGFAVIALIEFGLIMVLFLGDFLGNDFLMSYAKQRMIFLNINEVPIDELTNQWFRYVFLPLLFRIGFLSLLFGIIIGIFSIKTSSPLTFQSKKRLQKYLSLILIILGILFLIFPF